MFNFHKKHSEVINEYIIYFLHLSVQINYPQEKKKKKEKVEMQPDAKVQRCIL